MNQLDMIHDAALKVLLKRYEGQRIRAHLTRGMCFFYVDDRLRAHIDRDGEVTEYKRMAPIERNTDGN